MSLRVKTLALLILLALPSTGLTAEKQQEQKQDQKKTAAASPSTEQRAKMADMHERMAACLKSDASIDECRTQMREQCMQSDMDCPMMDKRMHGRMKNKWQKDDTKSSTTSPQPNQK